MLIDLSKFEGDEEGLHAFQQLHNKGYELGEADGTPSHWGLEDIQRTLNMMKFYSPLVVNDGRFTVPRTFFMKISVKEERVLYQSYNADKPLVKATQEIIF